MIPTYRSGISDSAFADDEINGAGVNLEINIAQFDTLHFGNPLLAMPGFWDKHYDAMIRSERREAVVARERTKMIVRGR